MSNLSVLFCTNRNASVAITLEKSQCNVILVFKLILFQIVPDFHYNSANFRLFYRRQNSCTADCV